MSTSLHDKRTWFEQDLKTVVRDGGFLSPLSFRYLEMMRGKPLDLGWLEGINANVALPLAAHVGPLLLDGLIHLDPKSAKHLASHGGVLSFQKLTNLTPDCAEMLALHEGPLHLQGLTEISESVCRHLGNHRGDLHLPGLTTLSEGCAEALMPHRFLLSLDGLSLLTDAAAIILSLHVGDLSCKQLKEIFELHGPTTEGWIRLMARLGTPVPPVTTQPMITAAPSDPSVHPLDMALALDSGEEWVVEDPLVPRFQGW